MTKPNNSLPLVTVYMPTYNRVALLQRAVESVLGQDYRNIELIVVDDNSTDGTHQYLAEMAEKDSRFRYFINEKNSGACVSRNKAIFAANGEYITGLDDDDFFLPNRITSFIKNLHKFELDCVALYTHTYVQKSLDLRVAVKKIAQCNKKDLISANWIGNQVFTKTEYLRSIGGFDENLPAWQDLECWYRLLDHYNSTAYSINSYSYTVDVSHPHERITSGKVSSVLKAYAYMCDKYHFNYAQKKVLGLQLIPYTHAAPDIKAIIIAMVYHPSLYNTRRLLSLI